MISHVLKFLFGKKNHIFNSDGQVCHTLPPSQWEAWKKRYISDPEMNWRNHTGTKSGAPQNHMES